MKKHQSISTKLSFENLNDIAFGDDVILVYKNNTNYTIGWGIADKLSSSKSTVLEEIDLFLTANAGEHIFTALNYDLKNSITTFLVSENEDPIKFPLCELIVCEHVLIATDEGITYIGEASVERIESFLHTKKSQEQPRLTTEFNTFISEKDYGIKFEKIIDHIQFGNIYEINCCVDFSGKLDANNHFNLGLELLKRTEAPHGAIWSTNTHFIACNSPERYLKKTGTKLISQPIKGTAKRGSNKVEDEALKAHLKTDLKERAENIMIVDLVRNDLSRIAKKNSVHVEELCEVYAFKTVNQLISTVSCEMREGISFVDILRATFPMGSMTGAPKISAMKIAEDLEDFSRGIYSGSIGLIEPNGDFDLNVVIRSLLVNKKTGDFKIPVGGAITIKANAKSEYEECLLKLEAIKRILC